MLNYARQELKKKCEHKKIYKVKIALFSLECSISFGEDLKSHMPFPIFVYPFPDFFNHVILFCKFPWATLIDTYHKSLQTFSSIVP